MNVTKIVWLPTLVLIFSSGCAMSFSSPAPRKVPDDFKLNYSFDIGALPPEYHYAYEIEILKNGDGQVKFHLGYGEAGNPAFDESFTLTPEQVAALYQTLWQAGVFTNNWKPNEMPPVGGSSTSLTVFNHGQTFIIPAFPEKGDREQLEALYQQIHDLVPTVLWDQFEIAQRQFEQEQNNP